MAEASNTRARKTEEGKWIFSTADTCEFFGVARETLSDWRKKGAPKFSRGKWDIKAVMQWRYTGGQMESPETRKLKAEADLKEVKTAQEKIKLGVAKGRYIEVKVVESELTRIFANVKKILLTTGHNCASALASVDLEAAENAKTVVDKCIEDALEALSEGRESKRGSKKTKKK